MTSEWVHAHVNGATCCRTSQIASPRYAKLTGFQRACGSAPPRSHGGGSCTILLLLLLPLLVLVSVLLLPLPPLLLPPLMSLLLPLLLLLPAALSGVLGTFCA